MTTKRLKSLRTSAFHAQSGHCYYCGLPMWLASPSELGIKPSRSRAFQCTAEHLVARQDGGRDVIGNVVAAHARCNQGRHKRQGQAPSPEAFRALVQKRLGVGRWWSRLPPGIARASVSPHQATRAFARHVQGQGSFGTSRPDQPTHPRLAGCCLQ
ncbi:HNH endonuclease [Stenotrophomonas maltophilia]|jgi:hypothetical protein|uniref:HNH endonuclease n=2 Tax=Lysobacteraceae TaxID=32033 RepID=UPI001110F348|nr:hypothetical protein [Stenotrophomonas maltophilia]MBA0543867.1 hypothetical protein [Stenotrophomonas maltophilia]MBH1747452.1 HNH endonuclease [Stenotrophomonas maltophilia]MCU1136095.1 HNH endonuclease [Stenotrophomonas maltophilia]QJP20844.1 hypothetical protein HKK60_15285 [Stenotrophomonas maltophilia]